MLTMFLKGPTFNSAITAEKLFLRYFFAQLTGFTLWYLLKGDSVVTFTSLANSAPFLSPYIRNTILKSLSIRFSCLLALLIFFQINFCYFLNIRFFPCPFQCFYFPFWLFSNFCSTSLQFQMCSPPLNNIILFLFSG